MKRNESLPSPTHTLELFLYSPFILLSSLTVAQGGKWVFMVCPPSPRPHTERPIRTGTKWNDTRGYFSIHRPCGNVDIKHNFMLPQIDTFFSSLLYISHYIHTDKPSYTFLFSSIPFPPSHPTESLYSLPSFCLGIILIYYYTYILYIRTFNIS